MASIFAIYKPAGLSSNQMLSVAKLALKLEKTKVGHGGTLDKLASGVLVVATGTHCKRLSEFLSGDKHYEVVVCFGSSTTTMDREGSVVDRCPSARPTPLGHEELSQALQCFQGTVEQTPPSFSAIKIGGVRAYELARKGMAVVLEPRKVTVHSLSLRWYHWPYARIGIHCGGGFYVRSFVDDLGRNLGCFAHVDRLTRTQQGPFRLADAQKINVTRFWRGVKEIQGKYGYEIVPSQKDDSKKLPV